MNNEKDYSPVVFSSVTELLWLDGRKKEIAVTEHKKKKGIAKKASIASSFKQPLTDILK